MHSASVFVFIVAFALAITSLQARTQEKPRYGCLHRKTTTKPGLLDVDEEFLSRQDRVLQTANTTYPNIRISFDFTNFVNGTSDFITYVETQLVPAVQDYLQAALAVKQPLTSPLKLSASTSTICGFPTPKNLTTGVPVDFYVMVSAESDTSNWVASGGSCYLSSGTKRPLIGEMIFNTLYTVAAQNDPLTHEQNVYLTIHEMFHALGFTLANFANFIDANGNTLTNQLLTVPLNGINRTVLNIEPLTSNLRSFYGCSTLPGAFMEDDGGVGTEGSHFERRHFLYEAMTSGVIDGLRISQFTFNLLEGSGWYMPNYSFAEPFFVGQGEGCNFLYQNCVPGQAMPFAEFCTGNGRACSTQGRGGGICSTDTRSDNCSYSIAIADYDCLNPNGTAYARLPTLEAYGETAGSMCFNGNLTTTTTKSSSQTNFCFKYTCVGSGLTTTVNVTVGTTTVTCTAAGSIVVPGLNGNLNCPDPLTFCSTAGLKYCPRNCMGRGTCVNNQCQCNAGFIGTDCSLIAS